MREDVYGIELSARIKIDINDGDFEGYLDIDQAVVLRDDLELALKKLGRGVVG